MPTTRRFQVVPADAEVHLRCPGRRKVLPPRVGASRKDWTGCSTRWCRGPLQGFPDGGDDLRPLPEGLHAPRGWRWSVGVPAGVPTVSRWPLLGRGRGSCRAARTTDMDGGVPCWVPEAMAHDAEFSSSRPIFSRRCTSPRPAAGTGAKAAGCPSRRPVGEGGLPAAPGVVGPSSRGETVDGSPTRQARPRPGGCPQHAGEGVPPVPTSPPRVGLYSSSRSAARAELPLADDLVLSVVPLGRRFASFS